MHTEGNATTDKPVLLTFVFLQMTMTMDTATTTTTAMGAATMAMATATSTTLVDTPQHLPQPLPLAETQEVAAAVASSHDALLLRRAGIDQLIESLMPSWSSKQKEDIV